MFSPQAANPGPLQFNGENPPLAVIWKVQLCPWVHVARVFGKSGLVMASGVQLIVSVRSAKAVLPTKSATVTRNENKPGCVGVPWIFVPLRTIPGGNEPDVSTHEYGAVPPDADKLCGPYGEFTNP